MTGLVALALASVVVTETAHVEDLAVDGDELWVATRGGLERYRDGERRLFTTLDGLAETWVHDVEVADGQVIARTRRFECALRGERFACAEAEPVAPPVPAVTDRFRGARVTARLSHGGRDVVGTAGQGVWVDGERLTPTGQVCANHATAVVAFSERLWLGGFDGGLCASDDGGATFAPVASPARMVNDLAVTPRGLYVAAGEGLFFTRDGVAFERVDFVTQEGVNSLAFDGRSLWATTPGALWRVRVRGGPRDAQWWMPGDSRSLQAVAVGTSGVWIATEDRGVVRKTRRGFEVFDRAAGAPSSWALAVAVDDRGRAWVGTLRDGVFTVDRRGRIRRVKGLPDDWILDVRRLGREMFIGTQGGAALVGDRVHVIPDLPDPRVHAAAEIGGTLWVTTEGGALRGGG